MSDECIISKDGEWYAAIFGFDYPTPQRRMRFMAYELDLGDFHKATPSAIEYIKSLDVCLWLSLLFYNFITFYNYRLLFLFCAYCCDDIVKLMCTKAICHMPKKHFHISN